MSTPNRIAGMDGEDVLQRLAQLERSNIYLRRVVSLGFFSTAMMVLSAYVSCSSAAHSIEPSSPGISRIVEAERFVVRDSKGRARGEFSVNEKGSVRLQLLDDEGVVRSSLGVFSDGPGLTFADKGEKPRVVLDCRDDLARLTYLDVRGKTQVLLTHQERPLFVLSDDQGNPRIMQTVHKAGPGIVLLSADRVPKAMLHTIKDNPELYFTKDGENTLLNLVAGPKGTGLLISQPQSEAGVAVIVGPDGTPAFALSDKKGRPLIQASISEPLGGMFHVQDAKGKSLIDVPK